MSNEVPTYIPSARQEAVFIHAVTLAKIRREEDRLVFSALRNFAWNGHRCEVAEDKRIHVASRFLSIIHIAGMVSEGKLQFYAGLSRVQSHALMIIRIIDGVLADQGELDQDNYPLPDQNIGAPSPERLSGMLAGAA